MNTAAAVTEAALPAVQADSYTYRDSVREMPTCWNPQQWQTEADAYVMNLTGLGLYSVALREDGTGYLFQPEMAAGEPVSPPLTQAARCTAFRQTRWGAMLTAST